MTGWAYSWWIDLDVASQFTIITEKWYSRMATVIYFYFPREVYTTLSASHDDDDGCYDLRCVHIQRITLIQRQRRYHTSGQLDQPFLIADFVCRFCYCFLCSVMTEIF